MALPSHLSRYQSLLDFLVEVALREFEAEKFRVDDAESGVATASVVESPASERCTSAGSKHAP